MIKQSQLVFLLWVLWIFICPAWQEDSAHAVEDNPELMDVEPGTYRVSYQNGELSLISNSANMSDVLKAISKETGIEIDASGSLDQRISVRFENQQIEDCLRKLICGYNSLST